MKKVLTDWIGLPTNFTPVGLEGFVYLVVNTSSQIKYVGRKYFWAKTRKKVKGRKRRKLVVKESDWRTYKSSSEDLKKAIAMHGVEAFEFRVLQLFKTRAQTNYAEIREMFLRDVLYSRLPSGEYEYFNGCILSRYYRGKI